MLAAPEFSSLVVSRPRSHALVVARARGLVVAVALYGLGLILLVLAPLLILEVMDPPKASVDIRTPVTFRPPGGGHQGSAGSMRHGAGGARSGAATKSAAKKAVPRPTDSLLPLPEPENAAIGGATDGPTGPDGPGDPNGPGDGKGGGLDYSCPDCTGDGPLGPGDGPYDQGTVGLIPPTLVPGSRALPKYPDLARKAGLQGTVVLLVVIEKDGTVGEIEVVKSPDQRWGFDLMAIEAVKQWRYQPALLNGAPVAAYIQVMVEFTLAR